MDKAKAIEPLMVNLTGTVYIGPCLLHSIVVDADGAAAQVDVYDGYGTGGAQRFRINVPSDDCRPAFFPVPLAFRQAVHVVVNAATTYVSLQIESA